MAKNEVRAVHLNFGRYTFGLGDLYIHRKNGMKCYTVCPRRVTRALEAQRLFLAQLEKKAGKV